MPLVVVWAEPSAQAGDPGRHRRLGHRALATRRRSTWRRETRCAPVMCPVCPRAIPIVITVHYLKQQLSLWSRGAWPLLRRGDVLGSARASRRPRTTEHVPGDESEPGERRHRPEGPKDVAPRRHTRPSLRARRRGRSPLVLLSRIQVSTRPALVVWAKQDPMMPLEHGRRLAALLPAARLVEVDDSSTLVPMDRPQLLAELLHWLVGQVTPTSA